MRNKSEFTPQLVSSLMSGYGLHDLRSDMIAGLSVAVVSFPLAMALAIASGLSPEKGIITAVIAGFIISSLGGSKTLIGGPTSAFVIVVFNVVEKHGYDGMLLATIMAGVILIAAGYLRLGDFIRWVPITVISGFTTGIAIVIATSQVKDFLGLSIDKLSSDFIVRWVSYFEHISTFNPVTLALGVASILLMVVSRRFFPRFPIFLAVVILGAVLKKFFSIPVETIGDKFPEIKQGINFFQFHMPEFDYEKFINVIPSAFVIAFLSGIESLLSSIIAGGMTGNIHRPNQELIAQGVANFTVPFFSGMPATGAFSRTAANIKAGAVSPMSGLFHAIFIFIFSVYLIDIVVITPLTVVASILLVISWGISGTEQFIQIIKFHSKESMVLVVTFILTVFVDIAFAIAVGVIMSFYIFIKEMSKSVTIKERNVNNIYKKSEKNKQRLVLPEGVEVFQINGPIFFGVTGRFLTLLKSIAQMPKVIIIRMRFIPYIDISGEMAIKKLIDRCKKHGIKVILSSIQEQPKSILLKAGIWQDKENIFFTKNYHEAIKIANRLVDGS